MTKHPPLSPDWELFRLFRAMSTTDEQDALEYDMLVDHMHWIVSDPDTWRQWMRFLHLQRSHLQTILQPNTWSSTNEVPDEAFDADLLAWARSLRPQTGFQRPLWWQEILATCQGRWAQFADSIQQSIALAQYQGAPTTLKGNPPPVAVFEEVDMHFHSGKARFRLRPGDIYAFRTFLPTEGFLAVLQVEEKPDKLAHQLIYPQHPTHLMSMGPGGLHLFSTRFEQSGDTHFLMLFGTTPFAHLDPDTWPTHASTSWNWDEETKQQIASYLLDHKSQLTPFLLKVEVQPETN